MDLLIKQLPASEYSGWPVHAVYEAEGIYDVEELDEGFRLKPRMLDEPVRHEWTDYLFSDWLSAPEAYGAFCGDELMGFIEGSGEEWHRLYRISNLLVYDKYRCRGVAQRLMRHMIDMACAAGRWRGVILETQTCNWAAIALYKKLGFKLCRIDACEYSNDDISRGEVRIDLILKF